MKLLYIVFLLLVITNVFCENINNCNELCDKKCNLAMVKDRCLKYCNDCCNQCKCIDCPCYRDKKNSKGISICPK